MASAEEKSIIASTGCVSKSWVGVYSSLVKIKPWLSSVIPRNSGTERC